MEGAARTGTRTRKEGRIEWRWVGHRRDVAIRRFCGRWTAAVWGSRWRQRRIGSRQRFWDNMAPPVATGPGDVGIRFAGVEGRSLVACSLRVPAGDKLTGMPFSSLEGDGFFCF